MWDAPENFRNFTQKSVHFGILGSGQVRSPQNGGPGDIPQKFLHANMYTFWCFGIVWGDTLAAVFFTGEIAPLPSGSPPPTRESKSLTLTKTIVVPHIRHELLSEMFLVLQ